MWSIDVSPQRAGGSASATDFVVSLPAVDPSTTRVISEVPLQMIVWTLSPRWTIYPSTPVLFKELTYSRVGYSVSVRGAGAWLDSVGMLNFSSAVLELSTGSTELTDEEVRSGAFCCN